MELNRNLCAFSAGSKALRAGRYNGDAKAIVLCVAHNYHERQRVYFHFYFLFYFRKLYKVSYLSDSTLRMQVSALMVVIILMYYLCFLNISFIVPGSSGFIVGSFRSFTMWSVPCLYFWKCSVFRWR